uniref:Uncharacterized protein n=1 Tax=Anguilla anguilla TaxID=7936 RepID=A0A0E9QXL4_ANGAN
MKLHPITISDCPETTIRTTSSPLFK